MGRPAGAALAAAFLVLGAGAVIAQSDPIATRKGLMKQNQDNAEIVVRMMRGQAPVRCGQGRRRLRAMGRHRAEAAVVVSGQLEERPEDPRRAEDLDGESRLRRQGGRARQGRRRQSRQGQGLGRRPARRHSGHRKCLRRLPQGLSAGEAIAASAIVQMCRRGRVAPAPQFVYDCGGARAMR